MKETLCYRFEEAIENESELDEALRRHAGECPACRALLQIVELHTSPIPAVTSEPLVKTINEQAAALAQQYAARHNRKRRLIPFLIGLIGWLSAVPSPMNCWACANTDAAPVENSTQSLIAEPVETRSFLAVES